MWFSSYQRALVWPFLNTCCTFAALNSLTIINKVHHLYIIHVIREFFSSFFFFFFSFFTNIPYTFVFQPNVFKTCKSILAKTRCRTRWRPLGLDWPVRFLIYYWKMLHLVDGWWSRGPSLSDNWLYARWKWWDMITRNTEYQFPEFGEQPIYFSICNQSHTAIM